MESIETDDSAIVYVVISDKHAKSKTRTETPKHILLQESHREPDLEEVEGEPSSLFDTKAYWEGMDADDVKSEVLQQAFGTDRDQVQTTDIEIHLSRFDMKVDGMRHSFSL